MSGLIGGCSGKILVVGQIIHKRLYAGRIELRSAATT